MILNPVAFLWNRLEYGKWGLIDSTNLVGISKALGSLDGLRGSASLQKFVPIVGNRFRDIAHCEDTLLHFAV